MVMKLEEGYRFELLELIVLEFVAIVVVEKLEVGIGGKRWKLIVSRKVRNDCEVH